jgi:hypothetical protein
LRMDAEEPQPTRLGRQYKLLQHQAPEQLRENAHGQQEVGLARYPTTAIRGEPAARHDYVQVRMTRAPRCFRSAAVVSFASDEALNKRS